MTSHSSTSTFNTCPFAYRLHKIDGLRKQVAGPESNKLAWGHAIHEALEEYYRGNLGNVFKAFEAAYPEDLDPQDQVWNREGGSRTLEAYHNYYHRIDEQWEVLDVEVADNEAKPTLIVDLVVRQKQTGSIYFVDHKCKAKMPWGADRRYEIDCQITRYTEWVREKYGDCAGGYVNIIVPGFRQRAYKGEPAGWHFKFERLCKQRTPQQIEFWKQSQEEWEGLIVDCELNDRWPKHLGYNCSTCEFYELCIAGNDKEVRDSLYTTEEVTPFSVTVEDDG